MQKRQPKSLATAATPDVNPTLFRWKCQPRAKCPLPDVFGMGRRLVVSMAFLALACAFAGASDGPIERATLKGLKAVRVAVDPPDDELQRAGVTTSKLVALLEQRLQKAGLETDKNAVEFVGLRVTAAHARKKPSAVSLTLGLYQNVTLVRDPKIKATTETWSGESIVLAPVEVLYDAVSNTVNQLVDQFADAYRKANPKEP
jgi:hypothetical protein